MTQPSGFTIGFFLVIVAAVAWMLLIAARRAAGETGPVRRESGPVAAPEPGAGAWVPLAVGVLVVDLGVSGWLAFTHQLDRFAPMPAPAFVLMGFVTLLTVGLALSPFGARVASHLSLAALVGFQFFRVPLEWLMHRMAIDGLIPVQMSWAGRNFDVVAGVTAALLAMYLLGGGRAPKVVFAWNLLGLGLLANIAVVAVMSTPSPFRCYMNEPANMLPSMFPFVWLPTFLVQAALFGHLVVFRALARRAAA